jgi:hypothetical protein
VDTSAIPILAAALAVLLLLVVISGGLQVLMAGVYARIIAAVAERKARARRIEGSEGR